MPQVKIRIEKGVETAGDGQENQEQKTSKQTSSGKVAIVSAFSHMIINDTKKIVSYSLSNVGQFTGNNLMQQEINRGLDILGDVASIGAGLATSISTLNPVPIIASIASVGIKYGTRAYSEYQEMRHAEYQTNLMVSRSGNSTMNGSRGTEN